MRGELTYVWSETWREIWLPLIDQEGIPNDIFCELYRELASAMRVKPSIEELANIIDDPLQSREAFENWGGIDFRGERELVIFFESAHEALDDLGGDALSNQYFNLLSRFLEKFSLRYDLRRPCALCPTLSGVFATLMRNLRVVANQDAHMASLMNEFEDAIRDLRHGQTDGRIKTCMNKQFMLLEALGSSSPDVTANTLGSMCDELSGWPHITVKESLKKLYGFASNYPGIRHGGNSNGKLRDVDMRDLVAMSIMLAGFTPYLSNELGTDMMYGNK
jgi:hypothetical protein